MKLLYGLLITLFIAAMPGLAQDQQSANDIVLKMQHDLNLSEDQVANITQIVERYVQASSDLQKSIDDGTMNTSEIDSQKQQIKAAEDQGVAQYLRPDQLYEWNEIQGQTDNQDESSNSDDNAGDGQYSNLPGRSQ